MGIVPGLKANSTYPFELVRFRWILERWLPTEDLDVVTRHQVDSMVSLSRWSLPGLGTLGADCCSVPVVDDPPCSASHLVTDAPLLMGEVPWNLRVIPGPGAVLLGTPRSVAVQVQRVAAGDHQNP